MPPLCVSLRLQSHHTRHEHSDSILSYTKNTNKKTNASTSNADEVAIIQCSRDSSGNYDLLHVRNGGGHVFNVADSAISLSSCYLY